MPVVGLVVAVIPVVAVLAVVAVVKTLLLPFSSAIRLFHRSRAARV